MPEVRGGERERRTGSYQPDFRPRGLRRRVSAESGGARRKRRQPRLCRRSAGARPTRLRRQAAPYPDTVARQPGYGAAPGGPISLTAPGVQPDEDDIGLAPEGTPGLREPAARHSYPAMQGYPPRDRNFAP